MSAGTFVPPAGGYLETVTFELPESLGANRSVRVVPYRRGTLPSTSAILALPVNGVTDSFTYRAPYISQVSPNAVKSGNETDLVRSLFTDALDLSDFRRLVITPPTPPQSDVDLRSFGPAQTTDGVHRVVEFKDVSGGVEGWSTADVRVYSWTHGQIVAYSRVSAATMRVRVTGVDPSGAPVSQVSNEYPFSETAPQVSGLVDSLAGYTTAGGEALSFKASGLATTQVLNVTVGGRNAQLRKPDGSADVSAFEAKDFIILPAGQPFNYPPFPDSFQWTIRTLVPEGEGLDQPVQVVRDGSYSAAAAGMAVNYLPPTITGFILWTPTTGDSAVTPWSTNVPIVVPTHDAIVRLLGTNLGLCPRLSFDVSVGRVARDACPRDPITLLRVPTTDVNRTHTRIDVAVPTGEGTGVSAIAPRGWSIELQVGGQSATGGPLLFRYAPPVVTRVWPPTSPTAGGGVLIVVGDNFGELSLPDVAVGSDALGYTPCTGVVRANHTALTCILPPGSGRTLRVRVQLADQAGYGGTFGYLPPIIANVTVSALVPPPLAAGYNGSYGVAWATVMEPYGSGGATGGDTGGGHLITLTGANFGPRRPGVNCVFFTAARFAFEGPGPHTCNGQEDFAGEGEVAEWNVVSWSHTRVAFILPAGAGSRKFMVLVGGQVHDTAAAPGANAVDFTYSSPALTEPMAVSGGRSTEGGDTVTLRGLHLPPPQYRLPGTAIVTYPAPLGVLNDTRLAFPLQHVVITFGSRCITAALDDGGRVPVGIDTLLCLNTGEQASSPHANWYAGAAAAAGLPDVYNGSALANVSGVVLTHWAPDAWTFKTPPGIGVNKSVSLKVYDYSPITLNYQLVAESNSQNFSYAPPNITYVDPSPLYVLDLTADNIVLVSGDNFGHYADRLSWTAEEQAVSVHTGGVECTSPERIVRKGLDMVQCVLNSGTVTVGFKNITIVVAGQMGFLSEDSPRTLQIVCGKSFYGHRNESCLACPIGAACSGYLVGYGRDLPLGAVGNVDNDGTGLHTYPVPLPGFYNLNGTESEPCPPLKVLRGRDVCVVACVPPEACLGNNLCAQAYTSKAPNYRCASCAKGYYRRGPECIRCPDSPYMLIVGVVLLLFFVAGLGYYLQRAKINLAIVSIGIDYFQVLAIFANSKIAWPPQIKDLFQILSAFNLNIEIVAPECLVPDVSFFQKWSVIMAIPLGVYVITASVHVVLILFRLCVKRQERKVACGDAGSIAVSSILSIFYLMYIYLSKNVFDVMTCVPADPPDGQTYMTAGSAAMEPCGKPGGTQAKLLPWAISALIVYVLGYPVALAVFFFLKREVVMLDQLLRAKGVGDDPLTNPYALVTRRTMSRAYYAFKPDYYWWAILVILRKLCITCTFVMFAQTPAFQLAASILIVFLCYAAQVKYHPYMPPTEFDEVTRDHMLASLVPGSLHDRLHQLVKDVETRGRKAARKNLMSSSGRVARANAAVTWLFNNNTVEAILLFSAVIVNLMAIMYAAVEKTAYADASLPSITAVIIVVLIVSITYFVVVLLGEIYMQCAIRRERKAIEKGKMKGVSATDARKQPMTTADVKKAAYEAARGARRMSTKLAFNPMFNSAGGGGGGTGAASPGVGAGAGGDDASRAALFMQEEPPDRGLWMAFKKQYGELVTESATITKELNTARSQLRRVLDAAQATTVEAALLSIESGSGTTRPPPDRRAATRVRTAYKPLISGSDDAGTGAGGADGVVEVASPAYAAAGRRVAAAAATAASPGWGDSKTEDDAASSPARAPDMSTYRSASARRRPGGGGGGATTPRTGAVAAEAAGIELTESDATPLSRRSSRPVVAPTTPTPPHRRPSSMSRMSSTKP